MQINLNAANIFDKAAGMYRVHGTPECLQLAYDAAVAFVPELADAPSAHSFQRQRVVNVASGLFLKMEERYA